MSQICVLIENKVVFFRKGGVMSQVVRFCLCFKMGETDIISHVAGLWGCNIFGRISVVGW